MSQLSMPIELSLYLVFMFIFCWHLFILKSCYDSVSAFCKPIKYNIKVPQKVGIEANELFVLKWILGTSVRQQIHSGELCQYNQNRC